MQAEPGKYPRLYVDFPLRESSDVPLEQSHAHYLKNVLRKSEGQMLRLFNGRDGEWIAELTNLGKKNAVAALRRKLFEQEPEDRRIHLLFSPIKKQRMDFVIEKAVELGVTDLHPVLMQRTENRKINADRIKAQIIEAAEQCERMSIPVLHDLTALPEMLQSWGKEPVIYACIERHDALELSAYPQTMSQDSAFLIGPEGGFDPREIELITKCKTAVPVTLGPKILRAETAALFCLSHT